MNSFLLFSGVTGSTIKIDLNGDSEGNFSVLALKPHSLLVRENITCDFTMLPVAYFQQGEEFPVSESWFSLIFVFMWICLHVSKQIPCC